MRHRFIAILILCLFSSPSIADGGQDALSYAIAGNWPAAQATAAQHGNPTIRTLVDWLYVQDINSNASFDEINYFLSKHPGWPDSNRIRVRAERAMRDAVLSDHDIIAWFDQYPPISGVGKWTYAGALKRSKLHSQKISGLVKEAWRDADLSESEEDAFLSEFGDIITIDDHRARVDRQLWEEKAIAATRLVKGFPPAERLAAEARIALIRGAKNAAALVAKVPEKEAHSSGLLFERLRYRAKRNDTSGVREILLMTPKDVPSPDKWWKYRSNEVRKAIMEGNYHLANRLLSNHGQIDGASLAEALWLDGWIKLEFLNKPKEAYQLFYRMYNNVKFPVSRSRGAYWAARAAEKSGDNSAATEWFSTAAKYVTTYHGQLALAELSHNPYLSLPDEPSLSFFEKSEGPPEDMKQAIKLCIQIEEPRLATRLIDHIIETAESEHAILAAARLGHDLDAPHLSVKAAKKALNQNLVLKEVGYPRPETDKNIPIERALALAITRQESEFNPQALSPAGARGLMQLMPATAQETAKKNDLSYRKESLYEPEYNMQLGSLYLARMINGFDGSYVKAIAAYNAGPGNVGKWLKQFGQPGKTPHEVINWIEKIPFTETRNYVQRVIENLEVYRSLEGKPQLRINEDLTR